jgi:lysophospholipase L1-like esterase
MGTFRVRNLLQTSLLMIASLAFALVAAEVTLRMTGLVPGRGGVVTVTAAEFERIPGMFGPNQDAVVNQIPQLRYQVRINNLGYRGADMPLEKPDGEYRILFVGDSFVFGDFVGNTETLPAQTEMVLRSQCNGMLRVINAGLGGSTITEHAKMIERSLRLEPDLVVLQFSENDVRDLAGSAMWDDLARNRHAKSAFPLSLVYPYLRNTALWNLALRAAATIHERSVTARVSENDGRENENARPQAETAPPDRKSPDESYRKQYRNLLTGLQSALRANDVPMMMAVMPSHLSVYDQWESDQLDWLEGLTRELGIDAVSFLPAFRDDGRNETELYLLPDDGHTSPAGYRVAARLLAERLIAYGRLSDHCGS